MLYEYVPSTGPDPGTAGLTRLRRQRRSPTGIHRVFSSTANGEHALIHPVESLCLRESRMQPPTRSALRIQTPPFQRRTHRTPGCAPLKRRRHSPARSTCVQMHSAYAPRHSAPTWWAQVQEHICRHANHARAAGLDAADHLLREVAVYVRDLVTEISGGATPHRCGVAQSSSSELATQARPSQPHSASRGARACGQSFGL